MSGRWFPMSSFKAGLDFFSRFDEYTIAQTSNSVVLTHGVFKRIYSEERFWPKYLRELAKLKAEIKGNLPKVEAMPGVPGRSFKVAPLQFQEESGRFSVQEIDLSKAYLTAAGMLGLIDSETQDRIGKLRKVWRLRLLGAIARRKVVQTIKQGQIVHQEILTDEKMRHAWFCICAVVDDVQQKLAENIKDNFLFYWYDNLFSISGALVPPVLDCCSEFSYRVADRQIEYKSRPDSLAIRLDDGRVFWLPSVRSHSVGALPVHSLVSQKYLTLPGD